MSIQKKISENLERGKNGRVKKKKESPKILKVMSNKKHSKMHR
jgi:hypothetical protein